MRMIVHQRHRICLGMFTTGHCWSGKAVGSGKPRTITHVFEGRSLGHYEIKSQLHSSDSDPLPF